MSDIKVETVGNHTFYCGHALDVLKTLPSESVHMVLTSPPYAFLRRYKGQQEQVWGGEPDCSHVWRDAFCEKCGAWYGALGIEPTIEMYIDHLVEIFRECRRILRPDGTLWLNIGDSYVGSGKAGNNPEYWKRHTMFGKGGWDEFLYGVPTRAGDLPAGNLALVPHRLALALQEDGWIIRSMIIWAKGASGQKQLLEQVYDACLAEGVDEEIARAIIERLDLYHGHPLPESVKSRPSRAHEYIILASKSSKVTLRQPVVDKDGNLRWQGMKYYYDWLAARENGSDDSHGGGQRALRRLQQIWGDAHRGLQRGIPAGKMGRNLRDVWFIPTEPSDVSHYAVMPSRLAAICIRAGTSEKGCCSKCGKPFVRKLRLVEETHRWGGGGRQNIRNIELQRPNIGGCIVPPTSCGNAARRVTEDWVPTCDCGAEPVPCVVLDPFGGVGTTNLVCEELGRGSIYIDVSEEYWRIAVERMREKLKQPRLL